MITKAKRPALIKLEERYTRFCVFAELRASLGDAPMSRVTVEIGETVKHRAAGRAMFRFRELMEARLHRGRK